jgi:hypothetical protein
LKLTVLCSFFLFFLSFFFFFFFLQANRFSVYVRERLAGGVWDTPLLLQFLGYPPVVAALEPPAKKQAPKPQTTRMLSLAQQGGWRRPEPRGC